MKKKITPPKLAEWLLRKFLLKDEIPEKLGDLEEIFWIVKEDKGTLKANLWYWFQVILAIPVCLKNIFNFSGIMFQNYFKVASRNLMKHKGYSSINLLGLAAGMTCCILILLWVQDEMSYDTFHKNSENLYRVKMESENGIWRSSPWALVPSIKNEYPEITHVSKYYERYLNVKYEGENFYEKVALVNKDFLEMFTYPFIKGNPKTSLNDINSIIISEKTSVKYFGNEDPIGKTIKVANKVDMKITGIIKDVPKNSHMEFDFLMLPDLIVGKERMEMWAMDCPTYIMANPNSSFEELCKKVYNFYNIKVPKSNTKFYVGLQPFSEIYLYSLNGTHPIIYIYVFAGIAFLVLLIACINFMNLSTARSIHRSKEIGMRKVIGAERTDIIKQFLGESILLSFISLSIAILLVYLLLPKFNNLSQKELSFNIIKEFQIFSGLIIIALFTGLLSGIYPALYLSNFKPITALKSKIYKGSSQQIFRKILIVFQFSAAIILIVSTTIILNQLNFIRTKNLGLNKDHIVRIVLDESSLQKYKTLKKELLNNKNITNVTSASSVPLRIGNNNPVRWDGLGSEEFKMIRFVCVDYDYFETFGMKMAYGRSFSREFETDKKNYIINETALEMTGYKDPIGKKYQMWKYKGSLVGVVKDFNASSLHSEIPPVVFLLFENLDKRNMFIKVNSSDIQETISSIKVAMEKIIPEQIFEYNFLDEEFNYQYQSELKLSELLEYFTILAIFISCLGLLGLASFTAEQKTKEIAIRKVLGASIKSIVANLSKEFFWLVVLSNLIAWPISYYLMNLWISGFAYHAEIGIQTFIISGIIALSIAILTVCLQALKSANRNPVISLKHD